jgi:Na+/H+ antiporter NhaD/arsenite permease-like protein
MRREVQEIIEYTLVLLFLSIFVFTLIYAVIDPEENPNATDALYTSATIQTLVGVTKIPTRRSLKIFYTIQSIWGFILAGGFIALILHQSKK